MATQMISLLLPAAGRSRAPRPWARAYHAGLLLVLAVFSLLLARGFEFYRLDLSSRIDHPDFPLLKPSGTFGYLDGVIGSGLLLFNLAYLPRRMFPRLPLGPMPAWLDAHVVSGLLAYVLLLFHSAFQQRTLLASTTFFSLTIVVGTGLIGRYLKALSPAPERERMRQNERALDALAPKLGDKVKRMRELIPPTDIGASPSLWRCLRALPTWREDAENRRRVITMLANRVRGREMLLTLTPGTANLVDEAIELAIGEVRSHAAGTLLRTWRSLHRFLAILMLTTVVVHIATAWSFGYRWIWSQ